MSSRPQPSSGGDGRWPTGWPAAAATFPLMDAQTPHYLQRFSYVHNDRVRVFDEQLCEQLGERADAGDGAAQGETSQAPVNKRVTRPVPGEGPSPKRREKDLELPPAGEHESASELGSERDEHDQFLESPSPRPHVPYPAGHAGDAAGGDRVALGAVDGEPALPSPTASPRSPASPDDDDARQPGDPGDPDDPVTATPRTTGAMPDMLVSARAFAPSNPLHPGLMPLSPLPLTVYQQPPAQSQQQQQQQQQQLAQPAQPAPPTQPAQLAQPLAPLQPAPLQQRLAEPAADIGDIMARMAAISHSFEDLPQSLRRYQLFTLFRGCTRSTLSAMYNEIEAALRFDILTRIPAELASMVLRNLDVKSVAAAAQVSKAWYKLVDSDELLWQSLLEKEKLQATPEDMQRAVRERWGYEGWPTPSCPNIIQPCNAFGLPVNVYKAIFRRLLLIHNNWMCPTSTPRRYNIQCPDREVITCLEFSDDIIIASTEGKKHLNVYDTQTGVLLNAFTSHEGGVWALKRVGKDTLVSGSTDHTVRVWSLKKNRCTHVFRGHRATVRCLDVVMPLENDNSRDYPVILTGSRDTTLRLWRLPDADDPEYIAPVGESSSENPFFLAELRGHDESVRAVSGYGSVAVSGSYDYKVRVWDLAKRRCRHILEGHENKVYATVIDPERNRCLSASLDFCIKVWDLETGTQLYTLDGHTGLVGLLGLRDNTLVSAAADKTLRIWDPESGRLEHRLVGHDTAILCFDHDHRRVVSGSERHLKLWSVRSGKLVRDLLTNLDHIWQVSFDSRRCIAAVSRDDMTFLEILDFDFDPAAAAPASPTPTDRIEEL